MMKGAGKQHTKSRTLETNLCLVIFLHWKNVSTGSISSFVSVVFTYQDRKITALCLFLWCHLSVCRKRAGFFFFLKNMNLMWDFKVCGYLLKKVCGYLLALNVQTELYTLWAFCVILHKLFDFIKLQEENTTKFCFSFGIVCWFCAQTKKST